MILVLCMHIIILYNATAPRQNKQTLSTTSYKHSVNKYSKSLCVYGIKRDTIFTYSLLRAVSPRKAPGSMCVMMLFFMSLEKKAAGRKQ